MSTFLIAQLTVHDPAGIEDYVAQVVPVVAEFGGRYVLAGPVEDELEGATGRHLTAVIEFDDRAALDRWYDSADYAPLRALRERSATSTLQIVTPA